ncbi:VWA domain-containing protein [Lysinibacillus sp. KU-BSD001]|uniref:VWA domain-containing protein n=1 Tax=Lysinibacillus sp. KU-BSD001 TaxID=3141328 RepID=UPI0036E2333D
MRKTFALFLSFMLLLSTWLPFAAQVEAANISDVPTSNGKYTAINWAVDNGVISLYTGNKFDMNGNVSEAEMLSMFAKLDANYKHSVTTDMTYLYYADLNIPLQGALSKAKRNNLVTRGDFAVVYAAMHGLDLSEVHAVQYLYASEITTGTNGKKTYEGYNPTRKLTRGDIAVFLYRMMQKGKLAVEGLKSAATGKDDSKVTLPLNFVSSQGNEVDLEQPEQKPSDVSPNTPNATKPIQSVEVEKKKLNANGYDTTLVTIKFKDSHGNTVPYDQSLKFKISSEYFTSIEFGIDKKQALKYDPKEIFQAPTAMTSPNGQSTAVAESDGGELNFFYRAPRMTKSLKDNILVELADVTAGSNFSSFKNSQIKVPIEYIVEPELRVTYEVYDGENYVGDGNGGQDHSAPAYPESVMKQGPITVSSINDDGTLNVQSVAIKPQYQYAKLTLAQREISEQMFERIVNDLLDNSGTGTIQLDYYIDENGNAAYNIPFSYIPNEYTSKFGSNEPQEYAVLLYLYELLPDKISDFSMADYKSVKSAQAIAQGISEAEIQNSSYKELRSVINGIMALAELADQTKADEEAAQRPGDMARYTKIAVTLVAPGGQIIKNYRGQVTIEYNGKKKTVPFNRSGASGSEGAGQAIAYFEGVTYGKSTAKVTFSPETDSRYEKLLKGLEGKVVEKEIIAHPPLNALDSCNRAQTLGVLVDESGSMKKADPYNIVNTETTKLINQLEIDPTYAFGFNTKSRFASEGMPLTPSDSIFDYKYRGGGTSLVKGFDALKPYLKKEEAIGNIPKALIIVTDGNFSSTIKGDMIAFAKENKIKIYTIAVGPSKNINSTTLKDIANQTEGAYFHLSNINNITNIYNSLMKSLCINYTEVCPPNFDSFQQTDVTIGRTYLFIEAEANCGNVEKVKVKFYSVYGEVELDLKYIGLNLFELEHDIRKIHNFSIYEEVEFLAYDKAGNLLTSEKVKIQ